MTTYYGSATRISTSKSLIVIGHDTSVINQEVLAAIQQGHLEYTMPDGIYVGSVQIDSLQRIALQGGPSNQLISFI